MERWRPDTPAHLARAIGVTFGVMGAALMAIGLDRLFADVVGPMGLLVAGGVLLAVGFTADRWLAVFRGE